MDLTLEKLGFALTSKEFGQESQFTKGHVVTLPIVLKNGEVLRVAVLEVRNDGGILFTEGGALDRLAKAFGLTSPEFIKWRDDMAKKYFCEFKEASGFSDLHLVYRPVDTDMASAFAYFMGIIMQFLNWTELQLMVENFGNERGCSEKEIVEIFNKLLPEKKEPSGSVN